jgi:hypothetical protein
MDVKGDRGFRAQWDIVCAWRHLLQDVRRRDLGPQLRNRATKARAVQGV